MAITYPRTDIMTAAKFGDPNDFMPVSRQELSRQASGATTAKDLGSAIWFASYTTTPMQTADAVTFEAILNSLDGAIHPFTLYDNRRPYPLAHSAGDFDDDAEIKSVGSNGRSIALENLPEGFTLSVGDYLAFDYGSNPTHRALHQVMEQAVADSSGDTPEFEIRPHLRAGAAAGDDVILKKPSGLFVLIPGSIAWPRRGPPLTAISFKAVQYFPE